MKYVGTSPVRRLAMAIKPRYHFAGKHHQFYERTPYRSVCYLFVCMSTIVYVCIHIYHELSVAKLDNVSWHAPPVSATQLHVSWLEALFFLSTCSCSSASIIVSMYPLPVHFHISC